MAVTTHAVVSYNKTLVYDKVYSNIGGGYDVNTGLFTCPVTGHYHLEISGLSKNGRKMYLLMQHNNQAVAAIFGESGYGHQVRFVCLGTEKRCCMGKRDVRITISV